MADFLNQYWPFLAALAVSGVFAGLTAGLFGIGGGAIIVPVLYFLLRALGFEETAMHVAVATSLATIIATSIRSVLAHHKKGAVDWSILKSWSPWIVLGAITGTITSGFISGQVLTLIFGCMGFLLAAQLYFGDPNWKLAPDLPNGLPRASLGTGIGILSALMGIGGGTFGVSLMTIFGRPIHQAVATAAGFGVAIGLPGALSAILVGWNKDALPPLSVGHVNLPAFIMISAFTVLMAPVGANLAHQLDAKHLKKLFGALLFVVAIRMVWTVIET